ncbi:MAG TPA: hypothetical protein VIY08_11850 [Candidatus Nitrosocosmicus sp.]
MTGNNPIDKGKLGRTKRHILTDKIGIPYLYSNHLQTLIISNG